MLSHDGHIEKRTMIVRPCSPAHLGPPVHGHMDKRYADTPRGQLGVGGSEALADGIVGQLQNLFQRAARQPFAALAQHHLGRRVRLGNRARRID